MQISRVTRWPSKALVDGGHVSEQPPVDGGDRLPTAIDFGVVDQSVLCTDRSAIVALEVGGGIPAYSWALDPPVAEWSIEAKEGGVAKLEGVPSQAGPVTLTVRVTDSVGATIVKPIVVHVAETPTVDVAALPAPCAQRAYRAQLSAHGGDATTYQWRITAMPGTAAILEAGDIVSADVKNQGAIAFSAWVTAGACESNEAVVSLPVDSEPANCPAFDASNLPAPCQGVPYDRMVHLSGGATITPANWRVYQSPPGLTFDPSTRHLSGTPVSKGTLDVEAIDANGSRARRVFDVDLRRSCWLAHDVVASGVHQLLLFDPVLNETKMVSEAGLAAPGVVGFAFSPDGRSLAYRTTSPGQNSRVFLLTAPDWSGGPLSFDGDVSQFVWSSDSEKLAVTYTHDGALFLSGVHAASNVQQAAGIFAPRQISAAADPVNSEVIWVDDDKVVFRAPKPGGAPSSLEVPYVSNLTASGFDAAVALLGTSYDYDSRTIHLPAPHGFYVIEPAISELLFYPLRAGDVPLFDYGQTSFVADPAGQYVAAQFVSGEGQPSLALYQTTGQGADADPWRTKPGCASLLAWSSNERLVCEGVGSDASHGALTIFDLDPNTSQLVAGDVEDLDGFTPGATHGRGRVFSQSGNWLATTTDAHLYVSSLQNEPRYVARTYAPSGQPGAGAYSELAFSPDEQSLLWHRGAALTLHKFRTSNERWLLSSELPAARDCAEEYSADPERWCGAERPGAAFAWSSDSKVVVAKLASGALRTWYWAVSSDYASALSACETNCGQYFELQP